MDTRSLAVLWHVHAVFAVIAVVGVILFLVWATKLKPDQLKKWVIWLLALGLLGSLITSPYALWGSHMMMGERDGGMEEHGMMDGSKMMQGEKMMDGVMMNNGMTN